MTAESVPPTRDPRQLPVDLPVPVDDGAGDHLAGHEVPTTALLGTSGATHDLRAESLRHWVVVYAYPRTGRPGEPALGGQQAWDAIPGARGCTPQSLGYSGAAVALADLGVVVYGLSTQDNKYQREAVHRLDLSHELLSDDRLELTRALHLPTFVVEGHILLRRLTLFLRYGRVQHVRYPVFPPDSDAAYALRWLREVSAHPLP